MGLRERCQGWYRSHSAFGTHLHCRSSPSVRLPSRLRDSHGYAAEANVSTQPTTCRTQFESIAVEQITELWENYGNLTEIWFDGGYTSDMKATLLALLERSQPRAVGMNGGGIMRSPVRWAGTEGDMTPGPSSFNATAGVWSTYCCNNKPGDPCVVMHSSVCALNHPPHGGSGCAATGKPQDAGCNTFYPAGVDYTLQAGDTWFWEPSVPLRPLSEMIQVYHNSVGRNTVMELDFAIDRTGQLEPSHAALYAALGGWIRTCYGTPVASGSVLAKTGAGSYSVEIDTGTTAVDRIVIQENQTLGQRILRYRVIEVASGAVLTHGESVGNKRIDMLMNTTHAEPSGCDFPTDLGNDQERRVDASVFGCCLKRLRLRSGVLRRGAVLSDLSVVRARHQLQPCRLLDRLRGEDRFGQSWLGIQSARPRSPSAREGQAAAGGVRDRARARATA